MFVPASNPSSTVVSDSASLAQNFSENAANVLCQASFGAGAYAIGGTLLGLPPLAPPAALATAAALVAAAALCPSKPTADAIFGAPPPFEGGQCTGQYNAFITFAPKGGSPNPEAVYDSTGGPISVFDIVTIPRPAGGTQYALHLQGVNDAQIRETPLGFQPKDVDVVSKRLARQGGLPDNCGSLPRTGGQIITNNNGDTINNTTLNDNRSNTYVAPVIVNFGGIQNEIKLPFSDITIGSLLPLAFNVNIGGTRFGFEQQPDGTFKPVPTNPDPTKPANKDEANDKIEQLLEDIKACTCGGESPQLQTAFIPVAVGAGELCEQEIIELMVTSDSYTAEKAQKLIDSGALALMGCESEKMLEQKPEELIYAATTLSDGRELFSSLIDTDVVSLRLKITSFSPGLVPGISIYPAANQHKFGSVSFVTEAVSGGGDSIYVYDTETYIPLPLRGKKGKLRLLMKQGVSFEVYDTGERVKSYKKAVVA